MRHGELALDVYEEWFKILSETLSKGVFEHSVSNESGVLNTLHIANFKFQPNKKVFIKNVHILSSSKFFLIKIEVFE